MIDPKEIAAAFKTLTEQDVLSFINEKTKNHFCPVCSTNKWTLMGDNAHQLSLIGLEKNGSVTLPPPSIPIVALCCDNCGYIRSHTMGVIAAWKVKVAK